MNLIVRNDKPYAFETLGKGSFCKKSWSLNGSSQRFCRATWCLQQISPLLTVKKGFKIFFAPPPPQLARSALKVCSKKQKTAFIPILGHFGMQNSEKIYTLFL